MSIGITRSYAPTGTIARTPPLVVVVSGSGRRRPHAPSTTPNSENLSRPGAMYPNISRSVPSGTTATCRW